MSAALAFGITAAARSEHALLGAELEGLGYGELWVNDTLRGDGIATLVGIAAGARSMLFGVGVIALSEQSPEQIAQRVVKAALPTDRLTLGVGSGSSTSLQIVRDGVAELRRLLPDLPIAVAAVGPRMARLAGEVADAVVANWALPDRRPGQRARRRRSRCRQASTTSTGGVRSHRRRRGRDRSPSGRNGPISQLRQPLRPRL